MLKKALWMQISEVKVEIRVLREGQSIAFEFSKSIGFDFFVISNAEERVFWELKPLSMQPIPIIEADMFGARIPPELHTEAEQALKQIGTTADDPKNPPVTRIVYGEVPAGYREVVKASPLNAGEKYCAFLFGDGFEKAGEYFCG